MLSTPALPEDPSLFAQAVDSVPIRILKCELGQQLPTLSAIDEKTDHYYQQACCLVTLHDHPLGVVNIRFHKQELAAHEYVQDIWHSLHEQILEHLEQDGLPAITELDPDGLACPQTPLCIEEREQFFHAAPFVSIIVSTHDRPERLAQALPALLAQHYPDYEVVIVDNAPSSRATADLIQQTYGDVEKLRYIREDTPGLSRGLNRGVMEARGEILAFTDDDVVLDAYCLLNLVKAFNLSHDVICVTGLVMPLELETPAQILFEEYGGFGKGFRRRIYDKAKNRPREPLFPYTAGRFGTGANMAVRPAFLKRVGGFDPALKCGMDIAVFFQVIQQGYSLVYEPAALAHHAHRRSYGELRNQIYDYGVALTAYLTKNVLEHPRYLIELVTKIPGGLMFTLSTGSTKNQKKSAHYPRELSLLEIKGMLHGPFVYLHKRWRSTTLAKRRPPLEKVKLMSTAQKEQKEHYEIEKELATRLRESSRAERKTLYVTLYDEFNQRVPVYTALAEKQSTLEQSSLEATTLASPQWRFLRRFLSKDTVFLEIGAGTCAISLTAARYVKKVFALEVSKEVTTHVKNTDNFELVLFDGFDIPVPAESINVAFSDQVIEHIHPDDLLEQLMNIYSVLADRGIYVCITPNRLNGPHDISRHFDAVATGFHLKEYTNSELSKLLKQAGFAKVEAYVGIPAMYVRFPIFLLRLQEALLNSLPRTLRWALACISLTRCIRLVGVKDRQARFWS